MKSIKIKELIEGSIYYCISKCNNEYIFENTSYGGFKANIDFVYTKPKYIPAVENIGLSRRLVDNDNEWKLIRFATEEEILWLQECIKKNTLTKKPDKKYYEIY